MPESRVRRYWGRFNALFYTSMVGWYLRTSGVVRTMPDTAEKSFKVCAARVLGANHIRPGGLDGYPIKRRESRNTVPTDSMRTACARVSPPCPSFVGDSKQHTDSVVKSNTSWWCSFMQPEVRKWMDHTVYERVAHVLWNSCILTCSKWRIALFYGALVLGSQLHQSIGVQACTPSPLAVGLLRNPPNMCYGFSGVPRTAPSLHRAQRPRHRREGWSGSPEPWSDRPPCHGPPCVTRRFPP